MRCEIDDLKAHLDELRERLGQNSNNSSKPPSSDPPYSPQKGSNESTGRGSGKQRGQERLGHKLKPIGQVDHVVDLRTADRFGAYNWLGWWQRQICRAHLKRDSQAMVDRGGGSEGVGRRLPEKESEIFKLWHQLRDARMSHAEFQSAMKPIGQGETVA